jgi:hypothetical protein
MLTFDLQDQIYEFCRGSTETKDALQITQEYIDAFDRTPEENINDAWDTKVRREEYQVTPLTIDILPFLSLVFINAHPTKNYLVNLGVLEMNIYGSTRYSVIQIYRVVRGLLQSKYENFAIIAEGQVASGIVGIYQYRVRFSPLISS